MNRDWKDIKWIFEPDGALIDMYVQEISLVDWRKVISLINKKYKVKYNGADKIDENFAIKYLTDATGEMESKSASIHLGEIQLNCHFFLENQIEFDINPTEINSIKDFGIIEAFMIAISTKLDNQVILTSENNPKFPLVKIDSNRGINRIFTEKEAKEYWSDTNSFINKMKLIKTKLEIKITPNRFKEKILKSASEPYQPTKKDKNVW